MIVLEINLQHMLVCLCEENGEACCQSNNANDLHIYTCSNQSLTITPTPVSFSNHEILFKQERDREGEI